MNSLHGWIVRPLISPDQRESSQNPARDPESVPNRYRSLWISFARREFRVFGNRLRWIRSPPAWMPNVAYSMLSSLAGGADGVECEGPVAHRSPEFPESHRHS